MTTVGYGDMTYVSNLLQLIWCQGCWVNIADRPLPAWTQVKGLSLALFFHASFKVTGPGWEENLLSRLSFPNGPDKLCSWASIILPFWNDCREPTTTVWMSLFSLRLILTLAFYFLKASRCVGKNSRVLVCHCRRADDRAPGACHCFQLQLLLSQGDRPGRDAVTKFQPCPELSIHAWSFRWDSR